MKLKTRCFDYRKNLYDLFTFNPTYISRDIWHVPINQDRGKLTKESMHAICVTIVVHTLYLFVGNNIFPSCMFFVDLQNK